MKAIILLSGGIDSTVLLALALERGLDCSGLSFDYGQRHLVELNSARAICQYYKIPQNIITIDPQVFGVSTLLKSQISQPVPTGSPEEIRLAGIPSTYVPARNTLFLSYALGIAEISGAEEIHFGMNLQDRFGYPDCRPAFIEAFKKVAELATKQAVESISPKIVTPLQDWDKARIISEGMRLNAPLELTHSCYNPTKAGLQCGKCNSCVLRNEGFANYL